jgi:hypothetical protein
LQASTLASRQTSAFLEQGKVQHRKNLPVTKGYHNGHIWGLCFKMRHKNKCNRLIKYSLTGIDGQNMQMRWSFATYLATETTDNQ